MPVLKRKVIRVKKCKTCGCLFICENDKYTFCSTSRLCYCNGCETIQATSHGKVPSLCEMKIIKSGKLNL